MALMETYAIASGSFLLGRFIYHRWFEDKPVRTTPKQEVTIPIVEPGHPVPLIYGRVRVHTPILAWHGKVRSAVGTTANGSPHAARIFYMSMLFNAGIPFRGGDSTNKLHNIWAGDRRFQYVHPLAELPKRLDEDGNPVLIFTGGQVEFLDGAPTSTAMDTSEIRSRILTDSEQPVSANHISGRRGRLSIGLFGPNGGRWSLGASPSVAYSFEVSSYDTKHPRLGTFSRVGSDSNPINVLYDLLTSRMGKLGIPESQIDMASFQAAQYVLHTETHGYSNVIDSDAEADEYIEEILRQIDGCIDEDPTDGKIKIKLVRNDYDPNEIPHITKDNCEALITGAAGGWPDIMAVHVIYPNREKDYADDSESEFNQASAATGRDGHLSLRFPGCTSAALAKYLAGRELSFRSRPILRFRAICDRSQVTRMRGDAVKVTMKKPNIPGMIFRVANVGHGTLEDGKVALDLVLDNFYVHRGQIPEPTWRDLPRPPIFGLGIT